MTTKTAKNSKAKAEQPAEEPAPGVDMKAPVFTRKGFVKEYHETELTNQLSGCRVVAVSTCSLAELPLGEDKSTTQRVRYGRMVITFPVVDDDGKADVDRVVIPGRLVVRKQHPEKKADAGSWSLDMKASEVIAQAVVDRLVDLKRDSVEVEMSFFGSFEQKTLEGLVEKTDLG